MDNTVQMFITIKGVSQCVKTSVRKIFYKSLLKMCAKTIFSITLTLHHDRKISLSRCYYILTYSPQRKLSRLSARLAPCSFVDCYLPARLKLLDNLSPSQLPRRRFAVTLNVDNFRGQIYRKASRMVRRPMNTCKMMHTNFTCHFWHLCGPSWEILNKQTLSIILGRFVDANIPAFVSGVNVPHLHRNSRRCDAGLQH